MTTRQAVNHDWFPIFPTKANRWSDITDITQISPVVYEKKAGTDDQMPALTESEVLSKEFRKSWARLVQKIYLRLDRIYRIIRIFLV